MPVVSLDIPADEFALLKQLASACSVVNQGYDEMTTHGDLDVPKLLLMLAEDAAMVVSRPGSWEGSSMRLLLASHGYQI
jgi:hypothetical protein